MKTKVILRRPVGHLSRGLLAAVGLLVVLSSSGCRLFFAETQSLDAYLAGAYSSPGPVEPTDEFYHLQWHYPMVDLPRAWGILQDPAMAGMFQTTYVAVIDTGIVASAGSVAHADLGSNVEYDPNSDSDGYDFVENDADPKDESVGFANSWHGTHVTGTIAADTGDVGPGSGVAGVGWATLAVVPIRALTDDGGNTTDVANGVLYAIDSPYSTVGSPGRDARVINLSLGGGGQDPYFYEAIEQAVSAGVTVVAAAGNEGGKVIYPAAYDNTIAVSAVDRRGVITVYSNSGPEIDFAAPGGDVFEDLDGNGVRDGVLSTIGDDDPPPDILVVGDSPGNMSALYEGTSMATPHVAGIVGLLYAYEPNLTQSEVYTILLNTAEDLGPPGRDDSYGWGLVQAGRALEYLINAGREHGVAPSGGALSPQAERSGSVGIAGVIPGTRPRGVAPRRRGALRPAPGAERHPTQILLRLEDAASGRAGRGTGRPSLAETARQAEALGNLHPRARLTEAPVRGPGVIVLEATDPAQWLTLLEELAADPAVRYAQPVYRYRIIE